MKKIFYSLMALMGLTLATACSDNEIVENIVSENPQENTQKIYLNASIPGAQTRVSYTEINGGMKMLWNENDYLLVFPGKTSRDEIKLSSLDLSDTQKAASDIFEKDDKGVYRIKSGEKFTSDKAYLFRLVKGETEEKGTFVYDNKVVYYEETETVEKYPVSSASNPDETTVDIRVKHHDLVEKTPSEVDDMDGLDISSITGIALWEHPNNEDGDCQIDNDNTSHLKYQEVLVGNVSSENFTTVGSTTTPVELTLEHPKTVIFKIIMNQFLYSIHRGAHVGIRTLKESKAIPGTFEEDEIIDGVYHQAREEFFTYNQTVEPAKIVTVPSVGDLGYEETTVDGKVFAGNLTETLITYIMVDASKLAGKRYFQFSLTDNWSHDLYVWRLDLKTALGAAEAGKFFTVDLTNRVCNQFIWLGNNDYVWAIRNHKAKYVKDEGLYYRYGEMTGQESTYSNEYYTPEKYESEVQKGWLETLRKIKADDVEDTDPTEKGEHWQLKSGKLPGFMIDLNTDYVLNDFKYNEYRIDYKYDAIYMDTKGLVRMPSATYVARIYDACDITLSTTFDGITGAILSHKTTGHKIFIPNTETKRPSNWSTVTNASTYEVNDKTTQVRIMTSTYPMNVVRKGNSSESWGSYVYYKEGSEYKDGLNKKAIYHGFALRGMAQMLHKAERDVSGSVEISGVEEN